jgi:hypothetical protein
MHIFLTTAEGEVLTEFSRVPIRAQDRGRIFVVHPV